MFGLLLMLVAGLVLYLVLSGQLGAFIAGWGGV